VEEDLPGEHLAGVAEEELQQVEFDPGQGEGARTPVRLPGGQVERELAEPQHAPLALETAAQEGPQPGQQLLQRERLDEVVVGAGIESLHPVIDAVTRRQHEDRGVVAGLPDAPADREPVDVGQLQVEHEGVGGVRGHGLESLAPRGDGVDLVPFESQRPVNGSADCEIIVHHQDAHGERSLLRQFRPASRPGGPNL
jgi:hypothetical protein